MSHSGGKTAQAGQFFVLEQGIVGLFELGECVQQFAVST
jgi:hypothetical protein